MKYYYVNEDSDIRLDSPDFLRHLVDFLNFRHEYINTRKTPEELIEEYKRYLDGEVDLYGYEIH